jgi:hypothetical protein
MFSNRASIASALQSFRLENRMLCYNSFAAKLYNWCLSLGFTPGKIMPSRAFCSDESQGFPIILLTKHFGTFPFNHGRVGGIVSTDRHGPHADHGKDLVLVQASHVGYDPDTGEFGVYRRLHTEQGQNTCSCGKIGHILEGYRQEYNYARDNIRLLRHEGKPAILIDNLLLSRGRTRGLFLVTENLVAGAKERGLPPPLAVRSTGVVYAAADALVARIGDKAWPVEGNVPIGPRLVAEDFYFLRDWAGTDPWQNQLERNLIEPMPWILTSKQPLLTAARANTMVEFDRTYHSLAQAPAVRGKNLLFLAGINIDISPYQGEPFPLTKFVPWAGYLQRADGTREMLEQDDVLERLGAQSDENPAQFKLDQSIEAMTRHREVTVRL